MGNNAVDKALSYFRSDFSCAQSVFAAHASESGTDEELALRAASAFGGGLARRGRTCGAVTGALMVLGMRSGHSREGDTQSKEKVYALAREFMSRFEEMNGSIECFDLIGLDLATPEGRRAFREDPQKMIKCEGLVKSAAEILEDLRK